MFPKMAQYNGNWYPPTFGMWIVRVRVTSVPQFDVKIVMSEYKKITKDDINFPKYCLYFIRKIQEAIDKSKNDLSYVQFLKVEIETTYPYCSEAFELIEKTFTRKGLEMQTPTFRKDLVDGIPHYLYKWGVRKEVDYDDLPFDDW